VITDCPVNGAYEEHLNEEANALLRQEETYRIPKMISPSKRFLKKIGAKIKSLHILKDGCVWGKLR